MDFKKYEKELNKSGYSISGDMVSNSRGDVVGQMDPYGEFHYSDNEMAKVICKAMRDCLCDECGCEVCECKPVVAAKPKKRAHNKDGSFKSDDKSTPDVNEAWEV